MIRSDGECEPIPPETEAIATRVVDAIYTLHRNLGPGATEKVYQICLAHELAKRGLSFEQQLRQPIVYDGLTFEAGYRLDFLVESRVIIEIKAVEGILAIHRAQVINYLKLSGKRLAFLVNFNVSLIREGLRRIVL